MSEAPTLKLGLPKGSLEEATIGLFGKAGWKIGKSSRSYIAGIDDKQLIGYFLRAQEIARYVEHGYFDAGLTGYDWVVENGADVVEVCDLVYSRASNVRSRWVIAVPEASDIHCVKDLQGKSIATEVVNIVRNYLKEQGVEANIEFSWGATEMKVPDLVDAIVDLTETGNSLRANKLRIVETILYTNTKFVANKDSWANPRKRAKIEQIALMLQAALEAHNKVGIKLNIPKDRLNQVIEKLPALGSPTVNHLYDTDWMAIDTIIEEHIVRELIPQLKEMGAEGIVEYPLNKIVL